MAAEKDRKKTLCRDTLAQQLYEQEAALRNYLRFWGVADGDVDELVQDIMVTVWRKIHTLRSPEALQAWVKQIARRKAAKHGRKMERYWKRNYPLSWLEEEREEAGLPVPEELIYETMEEFSETELYQLVLELGNPASNILILHYVYRETYEEIGNTLHINPATVRSIASRSREKLKKRILERRD